MLRSALRSLVPKFLRDWRARRLIAAQRAINADRSVEAVFTEIYRRNLWGGAPGEYSSGSGSEASQATAYAELVKDYVARNGITSVLDLGCGDYRVGRMLRVPGVSYVGIDVVEPLIEHNRRRFADAETTFLCHDVLHGELPRAELCLVRQVLQHLSNSEIETVLGRLAGYRHVLVTEHYPASTALRAPNVDKPHGPDTRVMDGSGVYLDAPPFGRRVRVLLESAVETPLATPGETIRTLLLLQDPS